MNAHHPRGISSSWIVVTTQLSNRTLPMTPRVCMLRAHQASEPRLRGVEWRKGSSCRCTVVAPEDPVTHAKVLRLPQSWRQQPDEVGGVGRTGAASHASTTGLIPGSRCLPRTASILPPARSNLPEHPCSTREESTERPGMLPLGRPDPLTYKQRKLRNWESHRFCILGFSSFQYSVTFEEVLKVRSRFVLPVFRGQVDAGKRQAVDGEEHVLEVHHDHQIAAAEKIANVAAAHSLGKDLGDESFRSD